MVTVITNGENKMAKLLITGGAGFYGINMTRYFLDRGHEVRSLDIVPFDYEDCKDRIEIHTGDIRDEQAVKRAVEGVDVVVHAAAALPLYKKEEIFSTDIDGTKNVMQCAQDAGIKRVVHISSTAVYGIPDHHPLLETDKMIGVGPYGEAKVQAEAICEGFRDKMCVPILRPKSFIGPERLGVFALFYDWAHTGHGFPMIGSGKNRYQLLDIEDLCTATYICATDDDEKKVSDTFNIGAKDFMTMREDFQSVLDHAGFGKKVKGLPAGPIIFTLRVLEKLKLSPLYKWVYETACEDSFVSIDKAERILGFTPKYSNSDALIRNYDWYVANLEKFKNASGVSHRVPWKQGILKIAKWFF